MEKKSDNQMDQFIEDYNLLFNVPPTKATKAFCNLYRSVHPNEFKSSEWSIDRHRKKFMDWRPQRIKSLL